jgi:hypothetical protein
VRKYSQPLHNWNAILKEIDPSLALSRPVTDSFRYYVKKHLGLGTLLTPKKSVWFWSREEDETITRLVREHGKKWGTFSLELNRAPDAIRKRAEKLGLI